MSSLLLYPKPLQGNRPASFLQQWHQKLTHPFNEMYWYGTPGPTLHGMPTPNGLAIHIKADATYRPGVRCKNISDAWKIYNTLKGLKTPEMTPVLPSQAGWKTHIYPTESVRVFDYEVWKVWHPNQPQHEMTLDEVKTWPIPTEGGLGGSIYVVTYNENGVLIDNTARFLIDQVWYIEEETGAVYLDLRYNITGKYEQRVSGVGRTFNVSADFGRRQHINGTQSHIIQWTGEICGVTVDFLASYFSYAPSTVTVPQVPVLTTFFKGIQFTTL